MQVLSKSSKETEEAAKVFLEKLLPRKDKATVVALSGDLGSGKTAFVQAVARLLNIKDRVTSPTFVLIKSYKLFTRQNFAVAKLRRASVTGYKSLFHIDAYQLKSGDEIKKLGWNEMIADPQNLIFIEWPENVADAIPKDAIKISFEFVHEKTRKIFY